MNKLERLTRKYEEIGEEIRKLKHLDEDDFFLLSLNQVDQYKRAIPDCCQFFATSSSCKEFTCIAGSVPYKCEGIDSIGIRPAFRYSKLSSRKMLFTNDHAVDMANYMRFVGPFGNKDSLISLFDRIWVRIAEDIYLAQKPVLSISIRALDGGFPHTRTIIRALDDWYSEQLSLFDPHKG